MNITQLFVLAQRPILNALNIVLISVIGVIIVIALIMAFVNHQIRKLGEDHIHTYNIVNKYAEQGSTVFLGDSITKMFPVQEFFTASNLHNRGISGNTTDDVLYRLDENVISIKPRRVFLMIGINDIFRQPKKVAVPRTYANIVRIITKLKSNIPDLDLHIMSVLPTNPKAKFISGFAIKKRFNGQIIELNKLLVEYCNSIDVAYHDLTSIVADDNGNLRADYTPEGLHLNANGYDAVVKYLAPLIDDNK